VVVYISSYGSKRTCNRPLSSRSPLSLTNTVSSNDSRTKSKGSDTVAASASPASAMFELYVH